MLKPPFPNMLSNWSNISSKPTEKGLSELNIDRSLLVIISSFVSKVIYLKVPLGNFLDTFGYEKLIFNKIGLNFITNF